MRVVADRITYIVHVRTLDDDGNPIGESQLLMPGQPPQPWTLYAHQFGELREKVETMVAEAEQQIEES
jgi:hypothetical protein